MDTVKAIMDQTPKADPVPTDVAEGITAVENMLDDLTTDVATDQTDESTEIGEEVPAEGEIVESTDEIPVE